MLTIVVTRTSDNGENTIKIFASKRMCTGGFESRHKYFAEENIAHQAQWLFNRVLGSEYFIVVL